MKVLGILSGKEEFQERGVASCGKEVSGRKSGVGQEVKLSAFWDPFILRTLPGTMAIPDKTS